MKLADQKSLVVKLKLKSPEITAHQHPKQTQHTKIMFCNKFKYSHKDGKHLNMIIRKKICLLLSINSFMPPLICTLNFIPFIQTLLIAA